MDIKQIIRDTFSLEEQIKGLQNVLQHSKTKIQEYFDKHKIKEVEVEPENRATHGVLIAKKNERLYIEYFADKLKEKLPELYNKIVNKEYKIKDIEKLKKLLKKAGISAKDFKECIEVIETPNKEALKQLYSLGEISLKDLEGCYLAKIVKSISITERKDDSN